MSKKTLLNESQIRSFMKLAKLEPLTPGFVQGLTESTDDLDEGRKSKKTPMREEEETVEEGMGTYRDEDEELDELRTGRTGALGPADGTHPSRGRGQGERASGEMYEEEMEVDAAEMEDAAGDEMEMDAEVEAPVEAPAADAGKMVSVDDFLSALERALEDAMGEEVEITDEMDDEVADDEPADAMDDMDDEPEDADDMDDDALMESITKRVAKRILMEALSAKK